ncbi:Transcription initiation factor TFIID subunit 13 [Papilio machaon]|uniref:Transcription initiation factor TFIID subunit 13 n=1 Tax=Papilio machaon TaxID=76193 RepID=A0A0N1IDT1_PAPMA|nr:Transcription initiation factor TFIID subunit 13 [Papilio machaon]
MVTPTPDTPDQFDQFEDEENEQQLGATASGRKRLFSKELRCMMYGFGDDQNPYTESVDFLEDLVIEFITETTHKLVQYIKGGKLAKGKPPEFAKKVKEALPIDIHNCRCVAYL